MKRLIAVPALMAILVFAAPLSAQADSNVTVQQRAKLQAEWAKARAADRAPTALERFFGFGEGQATSKPEAPTPTKQ